jgi:predicted glycoside hydrolase/deacetylase ChbG (UPF0249 family)
VIVNADDLGRSRGINRGVFEANDSGIVTSASLMTMWPASLDAAEGARRRPDLSVGLHVDLGEWVYRGDAWATTYERVALDDATAVEAEVARQLRAFRRLLDADPTHIDSHQHVHLQEPVWSILCELADTLQVPLRHRGGLVQYCGAFYGQTSFGEPALKRLTLDALRATLEGLGDGFTELVCHPGYAIDVASSYGPERELEVRTLCDEGVRAAVAEEGIVLASFRSLASSNCDVRSLPRGESPVAISPGPSAREDLEPVSPELVLVDPTLLQPRESGSAEAPNDGPERLG